MLCSIMNKRLILLYYSAIQKPTIKTCSIERQIPQWLSHDLSHPGSSPTTLTVRHKELRMGGDGCVSPPASRCLSQLQYGVEILLHPTRENKRMKLTKDKKKLNINVCKIPSLMQKRWLTSLAAGQRGGVPSPVLTMEMEIPIMLKCKSSSLSGKHVFLKVERRQNAWSRQQTLVENGYVILMHKTCPYSATLHELVAYRTRTAARANFQSKSLSHDQVTATSINLQIFRYWSGRVL